MQMRDKSLFEGIKILDNLRFVSSSDFWLVQQESDHIWKQITVIKKRNNESNKALYNRAQKIKSDYIW